MSATQKLPNGVTVHKWPHQSEPTAESVAEEMARFGFKSYDLQTVPPWFFRSRHAHDEEEIRGAVSGVTTFHFDEGPVTLEAGDILIIPSGVQHEVRSHNGRTFSAYKGSRSGARHVTEHGDGRGSVEELTRRGEQS
jgi:cupin superfamily acireductone dioxygenase involved in methionine salvage